MNDKNLEEFVEALYPYFLKKLEKEGMFKNCVRRKNATVSSLLKNYEDSTNIGKTVEVVFPYDTTSISVLNQTGVDLDKGDLVCLEYSIDLKNAVIVYKVN